MEGSLIKFMSPKEGNFNMLHAYGGVVTRNQKAEKEFVTNDTVNESSLTQVDD